MEKKVQVRYWHRKTSYRVYQCENEPRVDMYRCTMKNPIRILIGSLEADFHIDAHHASNGIFQ